MKVTIAVNGRFHLFDLARELAKQDVLDRLITTYPSFWAHKYGVPKGCVRSLLWLGIMERFYRKIPSVILKRLDTQYYFHNAFDIISKRHISHSSSVFIGLSSSCINAIRAAKEYGIVTLVERGSSHMLYQRDILLEEYDLQGMAPPYWSQRIVDRELMEYDEADYIAIPSGFVENTFLEKGISKTKILRNPYGVNERQFFPGIKTDGVFRIIYCGSVSVRKGIVYLLKAFKELHLKNAELWLIGSMTDEGKILVNRGRSMGVELIGAVREDMLREKYIQGSIMCLPSIEEGLAMTQLQGMACGLPLICTTNTGGQDIVREGNDGFVVPIRDIESLKEKILYLYNNRAKCEEMGSEASKRILENYTWTHYGKRAVEIYSKVARNGK